MNRNICQNMLRTSRVFLLAGLLIGVVFGAGEVPDTDYAIDTDGNTGQAAYDNVVATYPSGVLHAWTDFDNPYGFGDFEYMSYYRRLKLDCSQLNCVNPMFVQVRIKDSSLSFKEIYEMECLKINVAVSRSPYMVGARCRKDNLRSKSVSQDCLDKCATYGVNKCNNCIDLEVRFYCESQEDCSAGARKERLEMRELEEADIQVTREIKRGLEAEKKEVNSVKKETQQEQKRLLELLSDLLSNKDK